MWSTLLKTSTLLAVTRDGEQTSTCLALLRNALVQSAAPSYLLLQDMIRTAFQSWQVMAHKQH